MRILITGGAGFLGSHLVQRFLGSNHYVEVIDNLSTGSLKNLDSNYYDENFKFLHHDVREPFESEAELILNFACPASPVQYQKNPVGTIETCFLGMTNALHLAMRTGARVVQASTSEVYGDPSISPQHEEYWGNVNPIGIRSCYDEGKRAAETLCFDYQRQYGLDVRVLRIFNTYGPSMSPDDGRVVSNFIVQALRGEDLTIYGDGTQKRSFCFVEDLVSGIYKIANYQNRLDLPINLGNPDEFTIQELASIIIDLTGSKSRIINLELPGDDPRMRCPDISRAVELLDWTPQVDLLSGLIRTIEYFRTKV